ncbi:MAG: hydantoinase B/oxoprolinase family protein [Nitrospirota bacterium]
MSKANSKWRFTVDRGGTFTDVIGLDPSGNFRTMKLLSNSSEYGDASIEGIRRVLELGPDEALPENKIETIRFGTTVATNALLERKGGKVALLISKGFSDLLEIGYQDRPDIFSLCIKKTTPLYSTVIEVEERSDSNGSVVIDLNAGKLRSDIEGLKKENIDSIAVVLMHSWINPGHELLCEKILRKNGFSNIFLSHKTVNQIKIVSRGQSTLVDAYLSTVLSQYMEGIKMAAGGIKVEFMQSNGVLAPPLSFTGKSALLSGPAGGVIAVAKIAEEKEVKGAIGFDMGGTSTDVSRFDGAFQKKYEQTIAGIPLQVEMLDIITVAAGGGSILGFDGQKMTAGPESAGSFPGPACYGFGGPLTLTDANLLTGRIIPDYFPETFGPDRNSSLDREIVKQKFSTLAGEINDAMAASFTPQDIAAGFLRVANEKMALAIKGVSVSRGFDVREYALLCFGGAGGQHACSIASLLDINKIIIHPLSGIMSAYGIGLSKPALKSSQTVLMPYYEETHEKLQTIFSGLKNSLPGRKNGEGNTYTIKHEMDLRPKGAETFLTLKYGTYDKTVRTFKEQYEKLFGFNLENAELEVVNLRVERQELHDFIPAFKQDSSRKEGMPAPLSYHEIYHDGGFVKAPVYAGESLPGSAKIEGPAIIINNDFTAVIDPGFRAETDDAGIITITGTGRRKDSAAIETGNPDPVMLEVFNNLFMGIATEMGLTLQNTAYSVNMKERLDFSCAVFDSAGGLVANAPHIPVHLGSMADTVKAVLEKNRETMKPGDIYLTNNPYKGGSHLPDMTVISPVFSDKGELLFFTAARGHHSDVGGTTPGSMPPTAFHIDEEGVLLENFLLVKNNIFKEDELKKSLGSHKYPARNIPERISDFKAQIAACHKGSKDLQNIIKRYGLQTVAAYMIHIQQNSEYSVKAALQSFLKDSSGFYSVFQDHLDDGTPIKVAVTIDGGTNPPGTLRARIDFTGTGTQHMDDNLNAPLSVTRSAVMYVLRTLINRDVPLNSGCLKPVDIIIPSGTILGPVYPAAVASGNVETSQRIVDVLLGAFGIAAASQGTMNNLLFEVEGEPPYYETIAGGSGAVEDCPGASGVQVHMTNTRMTDPEILEYRHPGIRLEQFTLRKGSGGSGRFRGGDGVIREIKFLKPATVSIISERRNSQPYGMNGGKAGKEGANMRKGSDGTISKLRHREVIHMEKDESIIIETPGGGGFNPPDKS